MKNLLILACGFLMSHGNTHAQSTDSTLKETGKITIRIEKNLNGKKTVIDTTFDSKNESAYKDFLDDQKIAMEDDNRSGGKSNSTQRTIELRYDQDDDSRQMKIIRVPPGVPIPPLPPLPPMPPSSSNDDENAFIFQYKTDDLDSRMEELERLIEKKYDDSDKIEKELKKYEIKIDKNKRKRKAGKTGKRIIIIEEM